MNILVRADSSSSIGTGHIMRDLVIAKQFAGDNVIFATQDLPYNINSKIIESGFMIETLQSNEINELDCLMKKLQIDMVIIDHYGIDYDFEKQLKYNNPKLKILSLDDTYENHYCDILLNHNISADESKYKNKVPAGCELRCGSEYTLLREEFKIEKAKPKVVNEKPTVFVAMGGADHSNINIDILEVLKAFKNIHVNLVTTNANKKLKVLERYCNSKSWINLHINSNEIAKLMKHCDFAIVTPSVTVNEICFLEIPFIVIKTADNQIDMYEFLKYSKFSVLDKFNDLKLSMSVEKILKSLG